MRAIARKCMHFVTKAVSFSQIKSLQAESECPAYLNFCEVFDRKDRNGCFKQDVIGDMRVYDGFLGESEERSILDEIEPYLKRMRYEADHWDDAIHGYRETERLVWNDRNMRILDRVRQVAFTKDVEQLKYVHVLDLQKDGYIKPHIDAVRFCGDTIAGLSLLSDSVMRLVHDRNKEMFVDVFLKRRSLYVMRNKARFDYTHEILKNKCSTFKGVRVEKDRRISVICRNEPKPENRN